MKLLPQSMVHWALSKSCSLRPADRKGQNHREWSVENLSLLTASLQVLKLRKRMAVRQRKRTPRSSGQCTTKPGLEVIQWSKAGEGQEGNGSEDGSAVPLRESGCWAEHLQPQRTLR